MQKKLSIVFIISLLFFGCTSNDSGGIPSDIINGAIQVDNDLSDLQDGQTDSAVIAQEITDTIDTAINQLESSEDSDGEFTDIIQRIQAREPINYIEPTGGDIEPYSTGAESQESTE